MKIAETGRSSLVPRKRLLTRFRKMKNKKINLSSGDQVCWQFKYIEHVQAKAYQNVCGTAIW